MCREARSCAVATNLQRRAPSSAQLARELKEGPKFPCTCTHASHESSGRCARLCSVVQFGHTRAITTDPHFGTQPAPPNSVLGCRLLNLDLVLLGISTRLAACSMQNRPDSHRRLTSTAHRVGHAPIRVGRRAPARLRRICSAGRPLQLSWLVPSIGSKVPSCNWAGGC